MNTIGAVLSRKAVVGLAAVLLVAFGTFGFPPMTALLDASTPEGGSFDTVFFYSPAEALQKAASFSQAGREGSIRAHLSWDLAFPACYGFFCAAAWAFGLRVLAGNGRPPRYGLLWVPFAAVVFDLLENGAVAVLLASTAAGGVGSFTRAATFAATAASLGTTLKWLFVAPAFAGALVLPVAGAVAGLLRTRRNTGSA